MIKEADRSCEKVNPGYFYPTPTHQPIHLPTQSSSITTFWSQNISCEIFLSKSQPNHNSIQLNLTQTKVWFYMKLHTTTNHPHKLNGSNISAVTDPIWPDFKHKFLGSFRTDSVTVKFVMAIFFLSTFVHIRKTWPNFDQMLKVGSWDHL